MTFVSMTRNRRLDENPAGNKIGGWIVLGVLLFLLIAAGVVGYLGCTLSNVDVPTSGYVAMALGVFFSLAVGIGLMALVFYSSRKGFDEPPILLPESDEANELQTRLEQKR
jgi:hypothetical protein